MPAFAHIGVGFAAKRISPATPVIVLILAAELIEIIFMILWGFGVEYPPTEEGPGFSPYSHSILSGIVWSVLAGFLTWIFSKNNKLSWIIALLVFSHFLLDFIASPKLAFYPTDTGMPWFNDYSRTYGLGFWKYPLVAWIGEVGILLGGIVLCIVTVKKLRNREVAR